MNSKINKSFQFLSRICAIYNKKCDCEPAQLILTFVKNLNSLNPEFDSWECYVKSDIFEREPIKGSLEEIERDIIPFLNEITFNLIQIISANFDEWYPNNPEIRKEFLDLYSEFSEE